jgi:hypothetical protein
LPMDIFMRISRREDFIPGNATRPYKMRFATRTLSSLISAGRSAELCR